MASTPAEALFGAIWCRSSDIWCRSAAAFALASAATLARASARISTCTLAIATASAILFAAASPSALVPNGIGLAPFLAAMMLSRVCRSPPETGSETGSDRSSTMTGALT